MLVCYFKQLINFVYQSIDKHPLQQLFALEEEVQLFQLNSTRLQ